MQFSKGMLAIVAIVSLLAGLGGCANNVSSTECCCSRIQASRVNAWRNLISFLVCRCRVDGVDGEVNYL